MNPVYISIHLDSNLFKNNPVYRRSDIEAQFDELTEEEKKEEEPECGICLESHGDLIVVCDCKGSCKYVHKECIETWIKNFDQNDIRFNQCEICKSNYNLELLDLEDIDEEECELFKNTSCKVIVALLFGLIFSILMFVLIIMITY